MHEEQNTAVHYTFPQFIGSVGKLTQKAQL